MSVCSLESYGLSELWLFQSSSIDFFKKFDHIQNECINIIYSGVRKRAPWEIDISFVLL